MKHHHPFQKRHAPASGPSALAERDAGRDEGRVPASVLSRSVALLGRYREIMFSLAAVAVMPLWTGCTSMSHLRTPQRQEHGYIVILPGVEGRSWMNADIAKGLAEGGVPSAIEVHNWTLGPSFVSAVVNLRATGHNRREAYRIAQKIMSYQRQYPGRPVHLIGHSGGGGIAVFVLEALPAGHEITSTILLAPAVSPDYDLRKALSRTRQGIWNFYSRYDVALLRLGTTIAGTMDGKMTSSAGAVGFSIPWGLSRADRQLYANRLHQQRYSPRMAGSGHRGTHFGWANRQFVAEWLAPLIYSQVTNTPRYAADRAPVAR